MPHVSTKTTTSAPHSCVLLARLRARTLWCVQERSDEDVQAWMCRPVALRAATGGGFTGATACLSGWAEASVAGFGLRGVAGVVQRCDAAWGGELRGKAAGVGADGCEGHVKACE